MALWLALIASAAGMLLCSQGERLMVLTGQDPVVAARADDYLSLLLWATPGMILANVLRSFVSALGRPIYATAITGLGVGVNCLGNYTLVFGHFGAPAMGLEGSAMATVIASLVSFAAYAIAIRRNRVLRRYRIWGRFWRPEWQRFRDIVRIGTPVAVTVLAEGGFFSGAAFLMGRIGPSELAGHTLALNLSSFAFQVPFAIGQAAASSDQGNSALSTFTAACFSSGCFESGQKAGVVRALTPASASPPDAWPPTNSPPQCMATKAWSAPSSLLACAGSTMLPRREVR